jgi:hypothetical protein
MRKTAPCDPKNEFRSAKIQVQVHVTSTGLTLLADLCTVVANLGPRGVVPECTELRDSFLALDLDSDEILQRSDSDCDSDTRVCNWPL